MISAIFLKGSETTYKNLYDSDDDDIYQKSFCVADHNGKVLHLVQRLPVVTTAAASSTSSTNASATSAPGGGGGTFNPAQLVC